MRLFLTFLILISQISAEDPFISNPINAYRDALSEQSVELQSKKYNEALTLYLSQKPTSPSAIWHYNVGACFLALHEPGAAVYHFLEAMRIDPSLDFAKNGLIRARDACDLSPNVHEFRPFWVLPFLSFTILESIFLSLVLIAFVIASLGLLIRFRALVKVALFITLVACIFGLILFLRFLEPLEGVIVYPAKLQSHISGGPLPRAMLPGEQVRVLAIQEKMVNIETSVGESGWLPEKNCWVLSLD